MPSSVPADKPLVLGSHRLSSRLIVGTGKYASFELMRECLEASGSEVITVAVRRERLIDAQGREADVGSGFDEMSEASHPALHAEHLASGVLSTAQVAERDGLRDAMAHGGFHGIPTEWWHFDFGDRERVRRELALPPDAPPLAQGAEEAALPPGWRAVAVHDVRIPGLAAERCIVELGRA